MDENPIEVNNSTKIAPVVTRDPHTPFLALVMFVSLIISIFAVFLFWQNNTLRNRLANLQVIASPVPTESAPVVASPDPTAGWQTYTNNKYRYTFKYPLDWSIEFEDTYQYSNVRIKSVNNKSINVLHFTGKPEKDKQNWIRSFILDDNNYFTVSFFHCSDGPGKNCGGAITTDEIALFDQILSTFKFTNPAKSIGTITGKLCYPSEGLPPGEIVAKEIETGDIVQQIVDTKSSDYALKLPVGKYHVRYQAHASGANTKIFSSGYYTACVKDNPYSNCNENQTIVLLNVIVEENKLTTNINLCDFGNSPETESLRDSAF